VVGTMRARSAGAYLRAEGSKWSSRSHAKLFHCRSY
jgi:hypothetical protein